MPNSLTRLLVQENALVGTLDLELLDEQGLQEANFSDNRFNGTVELDQLPDDVEYFKATNNTFTGSLSLVNLPARLYHLDVSGNMFTGGLVLTHLPTDIGEINLACNNFTGVLDMRYVPGSLTHLYLSDNKLSGSLGMIPDLNALDISKNKFSGPFNFEDITVSMMNYLRIKHNNFEGNLDLSALPRNCIEFDASHNKFSGTFS